MIYQTSEYKTKLVMALFLFAFISFIPNLTYANLDGNGDDDGDGFSNVQEIDNNTNPFDSYSYPGPPVIPVYYVDTDKDGIEDYLAGDDDGDGFPDVIEQQVGTDHRNPDTDGDGLNDLYEWSSGMSPLIPEAHTRVSGLQAAYWYNLSCSESCIVPDILKLTAFPSHPDLTLTLDDFSSAGTEQENVNDLFGVVVTGYVTPPASGYYTFYVSGDEKTYLFFGNSPENGIQQVSAAFTQTNRFDWFVNSSQQSQQFYLEGGKSYFVLLFNVDTDGDDHYEVAWSTPWSSVPTVIPAEYLSHEVVQASTTTLSGSMSPDGDDHEEVVQAPSTPLAGSMSLPFYLMLVAIFLLNTYQCRKQVFSK